MPETRTTECETKAAADAVANRCKADGATSVTTEPNPDRTYTVTCTFPTVTTTFKIADETDEVLGKLMKNMGKASKGEVMQVAISVLKTIVDANRNKQDVGIDVNNDGRIEKLIILPKG